MMAEYLALLGFVLLCLAAAGGTARYSSGEGFGFLRGNSPMHSLILLGVFCATLFYAGLFGAVFPLWLHYLALNHWRDSGAVTYDLAWRSVGPLHQMAMIFGVLSCLYVAWRYTTLCAMILGAVLLLRFI
jgi:hypothetical protein